MLPLEASKYKLKRTSFERLAGMGRNSIPVNIVRELWADCGGFCQNPQCNKRLFATIDNEIVNISNIAHIIGYGQTGPRTQHELAEYIDKNGIDNLIMLCLECHKIIDQFEEKYSVEQLHQWKSEHYRKIARLFAIPQISNERELLIMVNDLLDMNHSIYKEYGPFSNNMLYGESGDGIVIWRKRCLDTIIPNNQMIIGLIEKNKKYFSYPWELYKEMLIYKIHADAFQNNCLTDKKVNDYKLFPQEFNYFVKTKLDIPVNPLTQVESEELEYRTNQIQTFIQRFLNTHQCIYHLEELNRATMHVELYDGRDLKVFVTNTYIFSEYTFEKVMATDPAVDVIICSCPAGMYSDSVKKLCIDKGIGLFMLNEFMGAIWKEGKDFLNFLLKQDREDRIRALKNILPHTFNHKVKLYVFGSYLRHKVYNDIDIMIVYPDKSEFSSVGEIEVFLNKEIMRKGKNADISVVTESEFTKIKFQHNNLTQFYP